MSSRRISIGLSVGAILGVICIVGANLRAEDALPNWYLFAFWYNRFLMGFVFILLPFKVKLSRKIIRGIVVGLFISFAFYISTNYYDFTGFVVGGVYGVILELALHYGSKDKLTQTENA
ncbi:MAG: hypothetical protein ACLFPM_02885 [Candidatus Izemoplasmatales bacterium]